MHSWQTQVEVTQNYSAAGSMLRPEEPGRGPY